MFSSRRMIGLCTLIAIASCAQPPMGKERRVSAANAKEMLADLADHYRPKAPDTLSLVVQFDFHPAPQAYHLAIEPPGQVILYDGPSDKAAFVMSMREETLSLIYHGKMTAFTAAGKASGADTAPLEVEPREPAGALEDPGAVMLAFIQRFFNKSEPERILLGEEYSRTVHGAHVIPLYYGPGIRSAWYKVKPGQRLNEPGDTNPFPQAFVIIAGEGTAEIGDRTIRVRAGESYYIPPDSNHVLWTEGEDSVELIWLAWGEGA